MQENGANVQKKESFLKRKGVVISVKTYFIDAMSTMALGLFASLLIGTIMDMVGKNLNIPFLIEVANQAKAATGPAMGVAIAFALKHRHLLCSLLLQLVLLVTQLVKADL